MRELVHSWDAWVFSLVIVGVLPIVGRVLYRRLAAAPEDRVHRVKLGIYASIVLRQWALVAILWAILRARGLAFGDLGLCLADPTRTLAIGAVCVVAIVLIAIRVVARVRRSPGQPLPRGLADVRHLVPIGASEHVAFVAVALTAGVCEELLFRGWFVQFLGEIAGSVGRGVVLSAVAFGLVHAYQGRIGVLRSAIAGLLFGGLYLLSRSLIPGQALHAALDIASGLAGSRLVGSDPRSRPAAGV